ncbi:hypothetical protein RIF29_18873 [Crotalaria pallida]|uniref:Reverse transcriptase zinc-binding domain-containing protein n=1 Tax=Crotalaria pallida TaxID=3830 RepID=A0AAN9IAW0_CROPI
MKAKALLADGFQLKVGAGDISFFFDKWLGNEPLCQKVPWVATQDTALRVRDVWKQGSWQLQNVYTLLPNEIQHVIISSDVLINDAIPDCVTWRGAMNGVYTAKSGYEWLINHNMVHQDPSHWGWIWKLKLPLKLNFFLWLVCHSAIPTNMLRVQRRCASSDVCARCGVGGEHISHCLRDCNKAKLVWCELGLHCLNWFWEDQPIMQWVKQGLNVLDINFVTVLWWIWRARCFECIANKQITTSEVLRLANLMREEIQASFGVAFTKEKEVRWFPGPPPPHFY